jgi:hypothetical protein
MGHFEHIVNWTRKVGKKVFLRPSLYSATKDILTCWKVSVFEMKQNEFSKSHCRFDQTIFGFNKSCQNQKKEKI